MILSNIQAKNKIAFRNFSSRLPTWGGSISLKFLDNAFYVSSYQFDQLKITNTCSIDYFLLATWLSSKLSFNFSNIINDNKEKENFISGVAYTIESIENNEWNRAKSI